MAKAICNDPSHLGGLEFIPLYHVQGIKQIKNYLRHCRMESQAGVLLCITMMQAQHQVGWDLSILSDATTVLPQLKSRWLPSLCKYVGDNQPHINLAYTGVYQYQQEKDQPIVHLILDSEQLTASQIKKIKYC
eukprot:400748-Ditylum_brightwellii.AAC.1